MIPRVSIAALVALSISAISSASAELRVSKVFGDHMVLQQEQPVRVWGTADPGATVVVGIDGHGMSVKAGDDGKWRADLKPMEADGTARTMQVVSGDTTIRFEDVLFGEVWICSGQSNMEWPLSKALNAEEEIAAADHPRIRLFNVPGHVKGAEPTDDPRGSWQLCSP